MMLHAVEWLLDLFFLGGVSAARPRPLPPRPRSTTWAFVAAAVLLVFAAVLYPDRTGHGTRRGAAATAASAFALFAWGAWRWRSGAPRARSAY
jgi:hypothetical protein